MCDIISDKNEQVIDVHRNNTNVTYELDKKFAEAANFLTLFSAPLSASVMHSVHAISITITCERYNIIGHLKHT